MSNMLFLSFDHYSSPQITLKNPKNSISPSRVFWQSSCYPEDKTSPIFFGGNFFPKYGSQIIFGSPISFSSSSIFIQTQVPVSDQDFGQENFFSFHKFDRIWLFMGHSLANVDRLKHFISSSINLDLPNHLSAMALCFIYIRHQIISGSSKLLSEIAPNDLLEWLQSLAYFGEANFMLSDGRHTAVFNHDANQPLYWSRFIPPHPEHSLCSDSFLVKLDEIKQASHSALLVSSQKFEQGSSNKLEPNKIWLFRQSLCEQKTVLVKSQQPKTHIKPFVNKCKTERLKNMAVDQPQSGPETINVKAITKDFHGKQLTYKSYKIFHKTRYEYSSLVQKSSHIIRIQPVEDQIQEVLKSTLQMSVGGEQIFYEDVFGNQAIQVELESPYHNFELIAESEVKIYQRPPDDFSGLKRQASIPLVWMPWQRQILFPYLLPPELPESQLNELSDFAMTFVERNDYNLLETVCDMNKRIYEDFQYVSGSTTLETTPFDVFCSRKGVCQDFANLFICLARLLSIPARYRVGYIYTGGNYENKIQADASHAWAEVYLPYLGWRGFDPTNGCLVNQDHIRIACGRNFRDATPFSGTIYQGGENEKLFVEVKVQELLSPK